MNFKIIGEAHESRDDWLLEDTHEKLACEKRGKEDNAKRCPKCINILAIIKGELDEEEASANIHERNTELPKEH